MLLLDKLETPSGSVVYMLLNPESYFANDSGRVRSALGGVQDWSISWEGRAFDALVDSLDKVASTP